MASSLAPRLRISLKVIEEGLATVFVVETDKYMASGLNEFTYTANGGRTIVRVVKHAKRNDKVERFTGSVHE